MSISVTRLKDYQAPNFSIDSVYLDVNLYEDCALIKNRMHLSRQAPGDLYLMGTDLELENIQLDGKPLKKDDYVLSEGNLTVKNLPDTCELEITNRIYPQKNTKLMGLYRSRNLFCTQCEAEGFRSITFYPDRPDVLTVFTTRISAEKARYPVLLSNGNPIDKGQESDGRHWVVFEDPFKKPSYLFALIAGDLACVRETYTTASGRKVDLQIYVEHGNENRCAHAMESLKRAMRWDEKVYGREYDLDQFMIVAVSDFNMGAMENKGLNIFNDKFILASEDTATDLDYVEIEAVVGHEYFHNWTGNRVTCRDWFQLSLKEGLTVFRDQEFTRDMYSRDVNRIMDVNILRNGQFPEDAGKMAHPVRPDSYHEISNFYTATIYNKGAEVIRMQHTLLGEEGFRKGMDLYFDRHDGQAVTIDDFVAAMEDANGVDLTQFKLWYSQAGTPKVDVETEYANNTLTMKFTQSCPPTPECSEKKPFHIPVTMALFDQSGAEILVENSVLELRDREETLTFHNLSEKPAVSLLRDFSAPIILRYDQTEEELSTLLRFESNGFSRWDISRRLIRNTIQNWVSNPDKAGQVSPVLLSAFKSLLTESETDMELRAEILIPMGYEDIISGMSLIDVTQIEALRDKFRYVLATHIFDDAEAIYHDLWKAEDHSFNRNAFARRKLRNVCLYYMMKAKPESVLPLCLNQFKTARTMSDKMSTMFLLSNVNNDEVREEALNDFYNQWSKNELVLDKWFGIHANCELPGTLERVKKLMENPAFSLKNPNRVYSLLGAFFQFNHRNFHAKDGSGYAFLTEILEKLDPINPQIAARLITPFTRWQRYDVKRQEMIQEQLQRLAKDKLSSDLKEIVTKSLM